MGAVSFYKNDGVAVVFVEKSEPLHHPGIESVGGVLRYLAHDVRTLLQPAKFATSGRRKDARGAIFAAIAVLHAVVVQLQLFNACVIVPPAASSR